MRYKLLVVDVDGTLVGRDGTISAEDREAVKQLVRSGVGVSLSTGRVTSACLWIIKELSLDGYHIFFDGALVSSPAQDKEVYAQPLKQGLVRSLVEFARAQGAYLELYSSLEYFVEEPEHWSIDIHRRFFGIEPRVVDFAQIWEERIIKGELVVRTPEELARARKVEEHFKESLRFSWAMTPAYPEVHFINVVDPAVSKGKALEALVSCLGVSLEEVAVAGDGLNDLPLLEMAGLAISMGNAPDEVKKAADYVTLDVDKSGLAAAIGKFLV